MFLLVVVSLLIDHALGHRDANRALRAVPKAALQVVAPQPRRQGPRWASSARNAPSVYASPIRSGASAAAVATVTIGEAFVWCWCCSFLFIFVVVVVFIGAHSPPNPHPSPFSATACASHSRPVAALRCILVVESWQHCGLVRCLGSYLVASIRLHVYFQCYSQPQKQG